MCKNHVNYWSTLLTWIINSHEDIKYPPLIFIGSHCIAYSDHQGGIIFRGNNLGCVGTEGEGNPSKHRVKVLKLRLYAAVELKFLGINVLKFGAN